MGLCEIELAASDQVEEKVVPTLIFKTGYSRNDNCPAIDECAAAKINH
jgi:hypothetical protein